MPGFEGGKDNNGWHGGGYQKKSSANAGNKKDKDWEPERYHLITR